MMQLLMICFIAALWITFRLKNDWLYIQKRRFEAFAVRDQLVRMRIANQIEEEFFQDLIKSCNAGLYLSEHLDLRAFCMTVSDVSAKIQSRAFVNRAMDLSKKDPEFKSVFDRLLKYIIFRTLANSARRLPTIILFIVRKREERKLIEQAAADYGAMKKIHLQVAAA